MVLPVGILVHRIRESAECFCDELCILVDCDFDNLGNAWHGDSNATVAFGVCDHFLFRLALPLRRWGRREPVSLLDRSQPIDNDARHWGAAGYSCSRYTAGSAFLKTDSLGSHRVGNRAGRVA